MNLQPAPAIVNEARLPEPVHEKTDPRPGGADHLGEGLLANRGDHGLAAIPYPVGPAAAESEPVFFRWN